MKARSQAVLSDFSGGVGGLAGDEVGLHHTSAAVEADRYARVQQAFGFIGSQHGTAVAAVYHFAAAAVRIVVLQQLAHAAGGFRIAAGSAGFGAV